MFRFAAWLLVAAGLSALGCNAATSAALPAPLLIFGRTGMGPGEFNYPRATAISPDGSLYIVDKAGRIQALSGDGQPLREWRMPEIDAGKPTGLGFGPDGNIYVADTHYARVCVYSSDGRLLRQFGSFGDGPGQFRLPTDVAVHRDGTIFVSEYGGNDRISRFTPEFGYLDSFGGADAGPARQQRPQCLLIAPDETLWVADACNHRLCAFDLRGRLIRTIGACGDGPGQFRFPYSVDLLSDGTLVVCEYGNNRVQRVTREGECLGTWGRAGRTPGELAYPWALSVGSEDRVYVVDSGNNRVQVIAGATRTTWTPPDGAFAAPPAQERSPTAIAESEPGPSPAEPRP
jgi:DNA-binding beta-propeller fold protein YncE